MCALRFSFSLYLWSLSVFVGALRKNELTCFVSLFFPHQQLGLKMFMECSAKTGENVDAAYMELARMVKHRLIDSNPDYAAGMDTWV